MTDPTRSESTAKALGTGRNVCCPVCGRRYATWLSRSACPECGGVGTKMAGDGEATLIGLTIEAPQARTEEAVSSQNEGSEEADLASTISYAGSAKDRPEPWGRHLLESADEFLGRIGKGVHIYRFEALLGSGGMGRVYLAQHTKLKRRCAVKILSPRVAQAEVDYVERFQLEGRAAAALSHPNVVVTHAIGQEKGLHFLEMEYVSGGSLRRMIREEGPLPPLRATHLVRCIADGLAAAHRRGIVHRDLKSDNVMLTLAGVPKISDFGLAKRLREAEGWETPTLAGTPTFMAPELFSGVAASTASDVYALGVIYFELLTGRVPFYADSLAELKQAVQNDPLPNIRELVPEMPLEMAECLSLLLERCPGNRPEGAVGAGQLLAAVSGNVPDLETLLREAFVDRHDVTWTHDGVAYTLCFAFHDGRRQEVRVAPAGDSAAEQLLEIVSVCGPAEPSYYEEALRLNGIMPHGGITIREIDGRPMFCAVDTYPRETADVEEIRRSVIELANRADGIERLLTEQDLY